MQKFIIGKWLVLVLALASAMPVFAAQPWLGVEVQSLPTADAQSMRRARRAETEVPKGLIVISVIEGSPAEQMGMKKDDILLNIEGYELTSPAILANSVGEMKPGDDISFVILRNGRQSLMFGKLGTLPQAIEQLPKKILPTKVTDDTELVVQLGHSSRVMRVEFSPSGKYLLSSDYGKSIKLWDTESGREIRSYSEDIDENIYSMALSIDEKYLFTGSAKGRLKLREFDSGQVLWTVQGHADAIMSAVFSQDGQFLFTGSQDKTIRQWRVTDGSEVRTLTGNAEAVTILALSPDGNSLLSAGSDGVLKLWNISTGRELKTFKANPGSIQAIAFSPDGRYVYSGSRTSEIKVWEIATGTEIRSFVTDPERSSDVAFSPDGRQVLTVGIDREFRLWDIFSAREILTFNGHSILIYDIAFSRDGKYIASGSEDRSIKIWQASSGLQLHSLTSTVAWIHSAEFSPDGTRALATSKDRRVRLWNTSLGKQLDTYRFRWDIASDSPVEPHPVLKSNIKTASFSHDGRSVLSRVDGENGALILWNTDNGKVEKRFIDDRTFTLSGGYAQLSPDEKYLLSGGEDRLLKLWDVASGQKLGVFAGHNSDIRTVAFSPDGQLALSAGGKIIGEKDNIIRLWDIATGQEIRQFTGHMNMIFSAKFSPDGLSFVSGSADGTVRLWDVASGKEIRTFAEHTRGVSSVAYSPDGHYVLSASGDGTIKLWDVSSGQEIKSFVGHSDWISSVSFSPDGKHVLSSSFDGSARIWDVASGKELTRLIGFIDGEWIVITPEGYYNASQNGHSHLSLRMGNHIYGIDQFYDVFYRPDIVAAKLQGEDISRLETLRIADVVKRPPPVVQFTQSSFPPDQARAQACYQVNSTGGGIGEVRVFHNGKLIQSDGYYRDTAKGHTENLQIAELNSRTIYAEMRNLTIRETGKTSQIDSSPKGEIYQECKEFDVVPGDNEISVSAFNSDNTVQSPLVSTSFQSTLPPQEAHLYILSIGIDQYLDQRVNLNFAKKDATDIEARLAAQSTTLYREENIHRTLLSDKTATKQNIVGKIEELSRAIKPGDSFILFVAGHGVLLNEQYYMLTHDYDGQISASSLISSNEIIDMSKKIKSLHQLLIFDTCHAGGVDYIVSGLYDARISVLAKKMGLHIYASANDTQTALDGYEGNGLFTHTLLGGMDNNTGADQNQDGRISVVGLGNYAKKATSEISKTIGHSQTPLIINFGKDYPLFQLAH